MISDLIMIVLKRLGPMAEAPEHPEETDMRPLRNRIDDIDMVLLALLNERSQAANVIGRIKKKLDLPVYAPRREKQVLDRIREANEGPLPDAAVRRLFERIIDETRSLERHISQNESDHLTERT